MLALTERNNYISIKLTWLVHVWHNCRGGNVATSQCQWPGFELCEFSESFFFFQHTIGMNNKWKLKTRMIIFSQNPASYLLLTFGQRMCHCWNSIQCGCNCLYAFKAYNFLKYSIRAEKYRPRRAKWFCILAHKFSTVRSTSWWICPIV